MSASANRARITSLIGTTIALAILSLASNKSVLGQTPETVTPTPFPPLATQVGFTDPEIDKLQSIGVHIVNGDLKFSAFGHEYRLLSFQPTSYKEHPEDQEYSMGYGTVLLYRMEGAKPCLIWKRDTYIDDPYLPGRGTPYPGDWYADGHILFSVSEVFATTGWPIDTLYIYELRSDDTVTSALRGVIPPGHDAEWMETQPDGKLLLVAGDYRDSYVMGLDKWSLYTCCGPYIRKYYEWQNGKFFDVSGKNEDRYFAEMGNALHYVTTTQVIAADEKSPALFSLELLRLLVIYEDIDEREAGWNLVQSLLADARRSGRLPNGTYVDQEFMPAMGRLFKDGKPFVAPDYVRPNPRLLRDTYNEKDVQIYSVPTEEASATAIQRVFPTLRSTLDPGARP